MWWQLIHRVARMLGLRKKRRPETIVAFRPFALR